MAKIRYQITYIFQHNMHINICGVLKIPMVIILPLGHMMSICQIELIPTGSIFILKNIQVNYDLAPLLKIKSVKSLKVNLNFQNFVTFANHRGYNPINGDTSNPWAKSIILGINAKF